MLKLDKFRVVTVSDEIISSLIYNLIKEFTDPNICIILSKELMSYHKKWMYVSFDSTLHTSFLRLCICLPSITENTITLTYTNLFNLNSGGSKMLYPVLSFDLIFVNEHESVNFCAASRLVLTRRSGINIKNNTIERRILANYFTLCSRYLTIGDVFSLNTRKLNFGSSFLLNDVPDVVYYRVKNVIGPEQDVMSKVQYYIVSPNYTKLQIDLSDNFFLPPTNDLFLGYQQNTSINVQNSILSILPTGLDLYFHKIKNWVLPFLTKRTHSEMRPLFLLCGKRGSGKGTLLLSLSKHYGLKYIYKNCVLLQTDNPVTTESSINNIFQEIPKNSPCLLHFRHIEALCSDEAGNTDHRIIDYFLENLKDVESTYPFVIFCTTTEKENLAKSLHRSFLQTLDIGPLDANQRISILNWVFCSKCVQITQPLDSVIPLTSSFVFADFIQLASKAVKIRLKNSLNFRTTKNIDALEWELRLDEKQLLNISVDEVKEALNEMNANYSRSIGAPQMQNVSWDDIGGLNKLKEEILSAFSTTNLPDGLRRSGLLLHGPPGTGKTLLAKAVATHFKYNFLSVKGPELLNMWVGQSEENVRQVFAVARASAPCIIFFDELDSLAPKRGESGGGGGVMDRVVSQLLAEMDGIQKKKDVFILAATNRSDLIDSALLRPGRLDKMLFVGSYNDEETRLSIIKALTRKFQFEDDTNFSELLDSLPSETNITGADFYGICSRAWLNAARRHINNSDGDKQKLKSKVLVSKTDMLNACNEFVPSS